MVQPDQVLDTTDPGDDMQRRIRYQATRAVMLALSLLDEDTETDEVICEQIEDILVKKTGNRFIGEQVKTKLDKSGPYKAIDEEIVKSIKRFVATEGKYGTHFDAYVIGTNAGFWDEGKSTSSLPYLLKLMNDASDGKVPSKVLAYLKKVLPKPKVTKKVGQKGSTPSGVDSADSWDSCASDPLAEWEAVISLGVNVFRKLRLQILPSLNDMKDALIAMLPKFQEIGDRLYSELGVIADALIAEALRAASLAHESVRDRYLAVFDNPSQIVADEVLRGKRITHSRLLSIIKGTLPVKAVLRTSGRFSVDDLPKGMSTLEKKMAAGGLSIANIGLAKDHKASTEYLLLQWLHRHGKTTTDQRYQHLRTVVRTESQEAYDESKAQGRPFGPMMLDKVRQRLRERHRTEHADFFDCRYEHLLGMAGILTEDCTLWWSEEFGMSQEDVA